MLSARLRACTARAPHAGLPDTRQWLPAAWRLMCSTPSDEFNQEMAAFFGLPGHSSSGGSASASAARGGVLSMTAAAPQQQQHQEQQQQQAGLLPDVHDFNAELFGVLGAPQPDGEARAAAAAAATTSAAALLSQQAAAAAHSSGSSVAVSWSSDGTTSSAAAGPAAAAAVAAAAADEGSALTHVDSSGRASMVDVSHKRDTKRTAVAGARVLLGPHVFDLVSRNQLGKGDVLTVAQLAGVMGAKHTSALIPLCHNILLSRVHVELALVPAAAAVDVRAEATTVGPTGVEMEALTAAAVAALTVYDMCKAASKGVVVTDLRLLSKAGGKSGDWRAA